MSKENGQQQKDSHPPLESSVPFLTSPARAAAGGNNKEDGKFFPYNSRIVRLKDEDRFQVCLDLRRKNAGASSSSTTSSTTTINTTNEGGEENEEERKSRVPNIGDVTAQFAVFDGHITSLAAKYAEKHWLECVFEAIEKEREEERRVKAKSSGGSRRGSGDNRRRSGSSKSRESSSSNEDGENENAEIDFELEKALIRATGELERGFKEHGVEEGDEVSVYYDPMIAKLVAHGADRDDRNERFYSERIRYKRRRCDVLHRLRVVRRFRSAFIASSERTRPGRSRG